MKSIEVIYEGGVFRPVEPVDLPEHSRGKVEVEGAPEESCVDSRQKKIYEIMSRRFRTGDLDAAERHNEHQP